MTACYLPFLYCIIHFVHRALLFCKTFKWLKPNTLCSTRMYIEWNYLHFVHFTFEHFTLHNNNNESCEHTTTTMKIKLSMQINEQKLWIRKLLFLPLFQLVPIIHCCCCHFLCDLRTYELYLAHIYLDTRQHPHWKMSNKENRKSI